MCSKITNHFSSISVMTEIYRLKFVNFLPIFGLWNLVTWPEAPKLGFHKAIISTHIAFKFQLCMSSGFWVIGELKIFKPKIVVFLCFFLCQFTITLPRIPKIGTNDAFNNSYVESKFQLSRFYCLLIISKSILTCQNSRTKTHEVPIAKQLAHYAFIW